MLIVNSETGLMAVAALCWRVKIMHVRHIPRNQKLVIWQHRSLELHTHVSLPNILYAVDKETGTLIIADREP